MATSHLRGRQLSPERTKVWTEPKPKVSSEKRRVPIVYYLSRNGFLEHPHFMELTLSSNQALFLKDFINRLNALRGKGMASSFSWSCKRSYKNGFVWQDLAEDDLVHPAHGREYVLKGSEIPNLSSPSPSFEKPLLEIPKSKAKNPWSSIDLNDYKVHRSDLNADAATQTDEVKSRRRVESGADFDREEAEISPPPSSSSSSTETSESAAVKADGRLIAVGSGDQDRTAGGSSSGRFRAAAVLNLMQLVSCGSISVKERGCSAVDEGVTRGVRDQDDEKASAGGVSLRFEDKEYFSGSLVETKKKGSDGNGSTFPALNNADRSSEAEVSDEEEVEGARAKCIPRKKNSGGGRREGSSAISRSSQGSKRLDDVQI